MQQEERLEQDVMTMVKMLERNRDTVLKILSDAGMELPEEEVEWEDMGKLILSFIQEKKAIGFFLFKLSETILGVTKSICWTDAIAKKHLLYAQTKGLLKDVGKRGVKDSNVPGFYVWREIVRTMTEPWEWQQVRIDVKNKYEL